MEPILTIDIGGTAIKFGVADETGRFLQKGSLPTRIREKGVDAFLADLLSLVRRVRNAFPITGIAVSLAGIVNGDTGELLLPSQFFPGLHRMNLVDFLEKETGLPALCENDVNCAALAEYWQGAGKGAHMLLCMTLGTGIAVLWSMKAGFTAARPTRLVKWGRPIWGLLRRGRTGPAFQLFSRRRR